jgi:phosphate-selective porin OprO/OprP
MQAARIQPMTRSSFRALVCLISLLFFCVSATAQVIQSEELSQTDPAGMVDEKVDEAAGEEVLQEVVSCDEAKGDTSEHDSESGTDCQPGRFELLPSEQRRELSQEISENTQDARTLKRILLGRSYTFFGRIEPEYAAYHDGSLQDENDGEIRRLRAGMVGVLSDTMSYKGEFDLTDGANNLSDFYLQWDTERFGSLTIGNQRVAQNLSAMTGATSLLFMERPLPVTTFSLARRMGISQDIYFRRFGLHSVLFTRDPNNDAGKYGASVRLITNPVRTDGGIAHLGFSFVHEEMDRDARYRTRPESHVTDIRLVDTGNFSDVNYQSILGLEAAGALGSSTIRVEGFASRWDRENSVENTFFGAYVELGHFLTGQDFRYRDGKFVRPQIAKGEHAWELGLRASWVDLNDDEVRGGVQKNYGFALNWYPRQNLRGQFNVIYYDVERDSGEESGWIAQARFQYSW